MTHILIVHTYKKTRIYQTQAAVNDLPLECEIGLVTNLYFDFTITKPLNSYKRTHLIKQVVGCGFSSRVSSSKCCNIIVVTLHNITLHCHTAFPNRIPSHTHFVKGKIGAVMQCLSLDKDMLLGDTLWHTP